MQLSYASMTVGAGSGASSSASGGSMAGEIEAVGAMATAGLAASTLDGPGSHPAERGAAARPIGGAPPPLHRDEHDLAHGACANCGTTLTGNFCAACGQSAHVHRSVGHIFEEFLHGIWHFDSKAWRTLPRLVFAPGRLTRDYVYGKRAGYIAPLALFLFSIFLMFFVFGMLGGPDINGAINSAGGKPVADARTNVADAKRNVADARREIGHAKFDSDTTPAQIKTLSATLAANEAALATARGALATVQAIPAPADKAVGSWQEQLADGVRSGKIKPNTGNATIDSRIREALLNPDFALYRIEQKAYKLSFLLIPLSLPTLWLLFVFRRDVHTYDHVVFALYSLSFMSLLFIVIALLAKFDPTSGGDYSDGHKGFSGGLAGTLILAAPVHMFVQLKGAYRLGWFGALWRTFVLSVASMITLGMFAALIVVIGLAD
ncbi:DUF3667 domain-containing protein [Polymorphobacter sp. PAMC 29334]|uniref:DUF3667 domain-containing protein n=1 Tax=Polymorphobacter sp. PAMC 29334 TaxID=2862331 RepID=UPI001C682D49|nr:DUF3667 domain-containing protein [Polymorphobacter sp. PAMC 29334]QYE36171.1 DUF3667 domain-containing protein [Polymorphobacter sp. PAMC 29334]